MIFSGSGRPASGGALRFVGVRSNSHCPLSEHHLSRTIWGEGCSGWVLLGLPGPHWPAPPAPSCPSRSSHAAAEGRGGVIAHSSCAGLAAGLRGGEYVVGVRIEIPVPTMA